jgi:hypothetical protein
VAGISYNNLTLSGSGSRTLGGTTTVNGTLSLSNALSLDNFNLSLAGSVTGASSANYLRTNGTGAVSKNIGTGVQFNFPVGNSAYNPVSITNNTGSSDGFSVRVLDEVYYGGTTGAVIKEPRVKRTWLIDKTNPTASTGNGVDFVFNWNSGEQTPGLNSPKLYHFDGTAWNQQTGIYTIGMRSLQFSQYKGSFSPFALGDDVVLLPVTMLNFHCKSKNDNKVHIQWSTSMEQNSQRFMVERSANGQQFHTIGEIQAAVQSQSVRFYTFIDSNPLLSEAYYRIKMENTDGNFSYSETCSQKHNARYPSGSIKVFPNPAGQYLQMLAHEPGDSFYWEFLSANGNRLYYGQSKLGKADVNLKDLSEGVYMIKIVGSGLSENHRIVIRR